MEKYGFTLNGKAMPPSAYSRVQMSCDPDYNSARFTLNGEPYTVKRGGTPILFLLAEDNNQPSQTRVLATIGPKGLTGLDIKTFTCAQVRTVEGALMSFKDTRELGFTWGATPLYNVRVVRLYAKAV